MFVWFECLLAELRDDSIDQLHRCSLASDSFLLEPADQLPPLLLLELVRVVKLSVEPLDRDCEGRDLKLAQLVLAFNTPSQLIATLPQQVFFVFLSSVESLEMLVEW